MKLKWLGKTGKIAGFTLLGIVLLLILVGGVLHTAPVQRLIARKAAGFATDFMACEVKVDKLDFNLFKRTATLRNVEILDSRNNRTVFVAEAMATLKNYDFKNITLASLTLYDPQIYITRYTGDSMSDFKRVIKKISSLPKKDTSVRKPFVIERARAYNGRFIYNDQMAAYAPEGIIDYKHVELNHVNAEAANFYSRCSKVLFEVKHAEVEEKGGFRVEDCSTFGYVDIGDLRFLSSHVKTAKSDLKFDLYLKGEDWLSYRDFINNIDMKAHVEPSEICLSDLRYFADVFRNMNQKVKVEGDVSGLVRELSLADLHLKTGKHTFLNADFTLTGLPKMIQHGYLDLQLQNFMVDAKDLQNMALPDGTPLRLPAMFSALQRAEVKGFFKGNLQQFSTDLDIRTNVGHVKIGNTARDTADGLEVTRGNISAYALRLDEIFKKDSLLGTVALDAEFQLRGPELNKLFCHFRGALSDLEIDGKTLAQIPFHIDWQKDFLRAEVECADTNLDFSIEGSRRVYNDTSSVALNLDLRNIDLKPLRLFGDTGVFTVKMQAVAENMAYKGKPMQGVLRMNGMEVNRLGATYRMPYLTSELEHKDSAERTLRLRSSQLEADLVGQWNVLDLKNAFLQTMYESLPHLAQNMGWKKDSEADEGQVQDFDLRFRLNDADALLAVFLPKLSLPLGMKMNLRYAAQEHRGRVQMSVPYIQWGNFASLDGYVDALVNNRKLLLETTSDRLYIDDSLSMKRFSLSMQKTDTNRLRYNLSWGGEDAGWQHTHGNFAGLLRFPSDSSIQVELQDFKLQVGNAAWTSYTDGYVLFAPQCMDFYHVGMFSPQTSEGIRIDGRISHDPNSVLNIQFNDFDFAYLEFFLRKIPMKIAAFIDGDAQLRDVYGDFSMEAQLRLRDIAINDKLYGQGRIEAAFNRSNVLAATFNVTQGDAREKPGKTILSFGGKYYPKRQESLDFTGYVEDFPVNFLDRLMSSVGKDLSGTAEGKIGLKGNLRSPQLTADVVCHNFGLTISMLNARYVFDRVPVRLSSSEIVFPQSVFVDETFKTNGKFGGRITHRNFKDIRLGLELDFGNLLALHTSREADMPFWGTVFATGTMDVEGPVNNLLLQVNAQVQENSDISFDFSNPTGGSGANFITFKAPEETTVDSGRLSLEKYYARRRAAQVQKGKLTLDFNLDITPGLSVAVRLRNSAMDGLLTATGRGALRLHMENDYPQLFGTYTIAGGGFDFSMVNLLNKKFKLKDGGTISWLGDVSDPRVEVLAGYQTKASLYPVLAAFDPGNDGRYKQKVNVESIIALSGNLMNPDITFDIDLLNADDDTKDKFWAVVQKNNEDEMLQQTFSLLMFNSFMAVESGSSSSVGNSALASSSELLFSQFNNFLSRLSTDFNIGINYKPGNVNSNSEFQVMMSGQLFDDRLSINGNLGVADNVAGTGGNSTTVVGDVDIEWKFTEELRLRGFNHSNDEDLTKPVNTYTQGVGIVFRRDFDNLNEFLHGTSPRLTKEERVAKRKKNREIRRKKRSGEVE